ncbi:MAG: hypothetical protein WCC60_11980 [Ilumatobacteraceae bacterium]
MNRRSFLAALIGTPALAALLAACGDDSHSASEYSVPNDADAVVLRVTYEGGFVPAGTAFVNLPTLLVSGDGRAFRPGPMTEQFPGPLLPAVLERAITSEGIQRILHLADDAGLLAEPPDYSLPEGDMVADASDTVVTLTVNGTTYVHRANALGIDSPDGFGSTPARDNLEKFVTLIADLEKVVGADNLGVEQPFVPVHYRFQAMVVDPTQWTDPAPTVVEWPAATGVTLADATQCATIDAATSETVFQNATQLTFFQEAGLVYQVVAVGVLPGDASC